MAYLDQMYSAGPQRTRATAQSASPYANLKGKFVPYTASGDYDLPQHMQGQGNWVAQEGVNYGGPRPGLEPYFNKDTGSLEGWLGAETGGGGSGLFGDFGGTKTRESWYIDPTTGQPVQANQTATPSRNSSTNFMSYAMPIAMMAGLGAGAAGGAFSGVGATGATGGMTAAEAAALGSEAAGGITGIGAGGTTAAEAAAAAGLGVGEVGASTLATTGPMMGAEGAVGMGGGASGVNSTAPWWQTAFDTAKTGKDYFDMAGKVFDLGKGIYDTRQNKDYSGNMKGIYSDLNARQDQFRNPLMQSYQDGGKSFYDSNQWKGLESVYQNKIDREASKGGRIANPTDREVKLQAYAMQELEKFRDGLRQSAGLTRPESALTQAAEGYEAERMAATPIGSALDQMYGRQAPGSRGQSSADIAKQIAGFGGDVKKIYDFVSGWFA